MLLELTLKEEDEDFGPAGSKVMINDGYVVGVAHHPRGSKIFVDMSDLGKFKTLVVREDYESWYLLKLNI